MAGGLGNFLPFDGLGDSDGLTACRASRVYTPCVLGVVPYGRLVLTSLRLLPSDLRREMDRRQAVAREREAFRRTGARLALSEAGPSEAQTRLREEVRRASSALEALATERRAVAQAEARDLRRVAWWVRPAVVVRAFASRVVLQDEQRRTRRALDHAHEALGRTAALGGAGLSTLASGPTGEPGPEWADRTQREVRGLGLAVWEQLRGHLFPKLPALAGMAVGWWIANTYTDSRVRSVLRTVGIGSGGTHVVSGSTYRAMSFWLPLLTAALCAYAGERLWERVVGREE